MHHDADTSVDREQQFQNSVKMERSAVSSHDDVIFTGGSGAKKGNTINQKRGLLLGRIRDLTASERQVSCIPALETALKEARTRIRALETELAEVRTVGKAKMEEALAKGVRVEKLMRELLRERDDWVKSNNSRLKTPKMLSDASSQTASTGDRSHERMAIDRSQPTPNALRAETVAALAVHALCSRRFLHVDMDTTAEHDTLQCSGAHCQDPSWTWSWGVLGCGGGRPSLRYKTREGWCAWYVAPSGRLGHKMSNEHAHDVGGPCTRAAPLLPSLRWFGVEDLATLIDCFAKDQATLWALLVGVGGREITSDDSLSPADCLVIVLMSLRSEATYGPPSSSHLCDWRPWPGSSGEGGSVFDLISALELVNASDRVNTTHSLRNTASSAGGGALSAELSLLSMHTSSQSSVPPIVVAKHADGTALLIEGCAPLGNSYVLRLTAFDPLVCGSKLKHNGQSAEVSTEDIGSQEEETMPPQDIHGNPLRIVSSWVPIELLDDQIVSYCVLGGGVTTRPSEGHDGIAMTDTKAKRKAPNVVTFATVLKIPPTRNDNEEDSNEEEQLKGARILKNRSPSHAYFGTDLLLHTFEAHPTVCAPHDEKRDTLALVGTAITAVALFPQFPEGPYGAPKTFVLSVVPFEESSLSKVDKDPEGRGRLGPKKISSARRYLLRSTEVLHWLCTLPSHFHSCDLDVIVTLEVSRGKGSPHHKNANMRESALPHVCIHAVSFAQPLPFRSVVLNRQSRVTDGDDSNIINNEQCFYNMSGVDDLAHFFPTVWPLKSQVNGVDWHASTIVLSNEFLDVDAHNTNEYSEFMSTSPRGTRGGASLSFDTSPLPLPHPLRRLRSPKRASVHTDGSLELGKGSQSVLETREKATIGRTPNAILKNPSTSNRVVGYATLMGQNRKCAVDGKDGLDFSSSAGTSADGRQSPRVAKAQIGGKRAVTVSASASSKGQRLSIASSQTNKKSIAGGGEAPSNLRSSPPRAQTATPTRTSRLHIESPYSHRSRGHSSSCLSPSRRFWRPCHDSPRREDGSNITSYVASPSRRHSVFDSNVTRSFAGGGVAAGHYLCLGACAVSPPFAGDARGVTISRALAVAHCGARYTLWLSSITNCFADYYSAVGQLYGVSVAAVTLLTARSLSSAHLSIVSDLEIQKAIVFADECHWRGESLLFGAEDIMRGAVEWSEGCMGALSATLTSKSEYFGYVVSDAVVLTSTACTAADALLEVGSQSNESEEKSLSSDDGHAVVETHSEGQIVTHTGNPAELELLSRLSEMENSFSSWSLSSLENYLSQANAIVGVWMAHAMSHLNRREDRLISSCELLEAYLVRSDEEKELLRESTTHLNKKVDLLTVSLATANSANVALRRRFAFELAKREGPFPSSTYTVEGSKDAFVVGPSPSSSLSDADELHVLGLGQRIYPTQAQGQEQPQKVLSTRETGTNEYHHTNKVNGSGDNTFTLSLQAPPTAGPSTYMYTHGTRTRPNSRDETAVSLQTDTTLRSASLDLRFGLESRYQTDNTVTSAARRSDAARRSATVVTGGGTRTLRAPARQSSEDGGYSNGNRSRGGGDDV